MAEPKELKPLIFPGGLVEMGGEHKLLVTARGSQLNRVLQETTAERPKQLIIGDRRILGVVYAHGVPFVVTDDRKGMRLEWAVVTTFREGLSPAQGGGLIVGSLALELTGLLTTHTWTSWAGVTAGVLGGALALKPLLVRQRGLRDLNLEVRPATLDGKAALVQEVEYGPTGQIEKVYLADRTPLTELVFSPNQADRLTRKPAPADVVVQKPRLSLTDDETLVVKSRFWESGSAAVLKADGRAFSDFFYFRGAWFVVRDDRALERVEVLRRGSDQTLYITLVPVTLNYSPVTVTAVLRKGRLVQDVKMQADVSVDNLVDPSTIKRPFRLRGFPVDQICAGDLDKTEYGL